MGAITPSHKCVEWETSLKFILNRSPTETKQWHLHTFVPLIFIIELRSCFVLLLEESFIARFYALRYNISVF